MKNGQIWLLVWAAGQHSLFARGEEQGCVDGWGETYGLHRAVDNYTMTVPGLDPAADYGYAATHAFVALPPQCVASLGASPNFADKDGRRRLWFGRRRLLPASEEAIAGCGLSWVVLAHGSGGLTSKVSVQVVCGPKSSH